MKRGFTKIEIIFVILLVFLVLAIDITVILYLNLITGDLQTLTDVSVIRSNLESFLYLNSHYPLSAEAVTLNDVYSGTQKLCSIGFQPSSAVCAKVLLSTIPNSFGPYLYKSDGQNYQLEFNLTGDLNNLGLNKGINCATNNQITSQACF